MRSAGLAILLLACTTPDDRCDVDACVDVLELPWVGTGSAGRGEVGFRISVDEPGFLAVDAPGCLHGATRC